MAKKREYTYFLEPAKRNFSHTNEVVSKMLADSASTSSDSSAGTSMIRDRVCADGKTHNLYYCPSGLLFMLWTIKADLKINFRIFCQEGNGQIRDVTNWYRKRHTTKKEASHGRF